METLTLGLKSLRLKLYIYNIKNSKLTPKLIGLVFLAIDMLGLAESS